MHSSEIYAGIKYVVLGDSCLVSFVCSGAAWALGLWAGRRVRDEPRGVPTKRSVRFGTRCGRFIAIMYVWLLLLFVCLSSIHMAL